MSHDPHANDRSTSWGWCARVPELIWSPLMTGALMLLSGGIGWALGQPWLFPSLGPTAFMQAHKPASPASRLYNALVGHAIGIASGYACVYAVNAFAVPPVMLSDHVTPSRLWASALAVAVTLLVQIVARAYHPPAGATTLIISLGVVRMGWRDAVALVVGIAIVSLVGELVRRARLAGHRPP